MGNQRLVEEQIRSIYFGLISDPTYHSYENLVSNFAKELSGLLGSVYVGLYINNHSEGKYDLIADEKDGATIPTFLQDINIYYGRLELQSKSAYTNGEEIFQSHPSEIKTSIINLKVNDEDIDFLLLIARKEILVDAELLLIKKETEGFLRVANFYSTSIEGEKMNEYLYSLSSHLHSSTDKKVVLGRIVESLENIYQDYAHYLLLSHEFEVDSSLPIKSIEYGDANVQRHTSTAFISGEVQIEHLSNCTRLYAPLLGNQGVYGVIQIITQRVTHFRETDLVFIAQIAQTAGKALESVTLYENSVHLIADLQLINDVTHKLNSNLDFAELIKILKSELLKICQATEIGCMYYDEKYEGAYEILMESSPFFHSNQGYLFTEFVAQQMTKDLEPIFSGDFTKDYPKFPYHSVIVIPMIQSDFNYGFIIALHEKDSFFTFEAFKLMQSLIRHSTLALTNTMLKDKLEKAVITDYLTSLYSRNHLDKTLHKHMQNDKQGTFILFDIDDFKAVNDTYGHHIGDEVIIQISDIIRANISDKDLPARWGGEEFSVYLPYDNISKGVEVAERIRIEVANRTGPSVTFSCGVSTWSKQQADSASAVFIRADQALYEAKKSGKNCVVTENQLSDYVIK